MNSFFDVLNIGVYRRQHDFEMMLKKVQHTFKEKLYKENRFRYNGLEEEEIDAFLKIIQGKMKDSKRLFSRCKQMREGSLKMESQFDRYARNKEAKRQQSNDVKKQIEKQIQESFYMNHTTILKEQKSQELPNSAKSNPKAPSTSTKSLNSITLLNRQLQSQQSSKSNDKDKDEYEDEGDKIVTSDFCLSQLNSIIIGTYITSNNRHFTKQSKNMIIFQNAIIKTQQKDYYSDVLHINLIKTDQDELLFTMEMENENERFCKLQEEMNK